jgi:hypothetical protein
VASQPPPRAQPAQKSVAQRQAPLASRLAQSGSRSAHACCGGSARRVSPPLAPAKAGRASSASVVGCPPCPATWAAGAETVAGEASARSRPQSARCTASASGNVTRAWNGRGGPAARDLRAPRKAPSCRHRCGHCAGLKSHRCNEHASIFMLPVRAVRSEGALVSILMVSNSP